MPTPLSGLWKPWAIVPEEHGLTNPTDHVFPLNYTPFNQAFFTYEIADRIALPTFDGLTSSVTLGLGTLGGGVLSTITTNASALFELTRTRGAWAGSGSPQIMRRGPKLGYHVGNRFKHLSYFRLSGTVEGIVQGGFITWRNGTGYASPELAANCTLRQMYLEYGRLLSIREEDYNAETDVQTLWLKIYNKSGNIPEEFNYSKGITIWSKKDLGTVEAAAIEGEGGDEDIWKEHNLDVIEVNENLELKVRITGASTSYLSVGDLFKLEEKWIVENPNLIHMWNLQLDKEYDSHSTSQQLYGIGERSAVATPKIIGVWNPNVEFSTEITIDAEAEPPLTATKTLLVKQLYINEDDKEKFGINLPSIIGENEDGEKISNEAFERKEHPEVGGNFSEGKNLIPEDVETINLLFDITFGRYLDNFAANSLAGQYFITDYGGAEGVYEIVDNPRGDSLEIRNKSLNGAEDLITKVGRGLKFDIIQQKFWMFSEMFVPFTTSNLENIFSGRVTKSEFNSEDAITTVEWKTRDDHASAILSLFEQDLVESEYLSLPQRIKSELHDSLKLTKHNAAYSNFKNWSILNISTNLRFNLSDISFEDINEDDKLFNVKIKAVINGDVSDMFKESRVGIVFDKPHDIIGASPENNFFADLSVTFGGEGQQQWAFVNGELNMGGHQFAEVISSDDKLTITDANYFSFSNSGFPLFYITVKDKSGIWLSAVTESLSDVARIFYLDPVTSLVFDRKYIDMYRTEEVVRIGPPELFSERDTEEESYVFTGLMSKIKDISNEEKERGSYWVALPDFHRGITETLYFAGPVSGLGNIESPLIYREGEGEVPYEVINISTSRKMMPFEISAAISEDSINRIPCYYLKKKSEKIEDVAKDLGVVSTVGKFDDLISMLEGKGSPEVDSAQDAEDHELTKSSMLINNSFSGKIHKKNDGGMLLVHGVTLPPKVKIDDEEPLGYQADVVQILTTENNGNYWVSPRHALYETEEELEDSEEAFLPLVILKDFRLIDSIYEKETENLYLFGYLYSKYENDNNDNGYVIDDSTFTLSLYKVSIPILLNEDISVLKELSVGENDAFAYYREPEIKIYADYESEDNGTALPDARWPIPSSGFEVLIQIIGQQPFDEPLVLDPQIVYSGMVELTSFSVSLKDDNDFRIWFPDSNSNNRLITIWSKNSGASWAVETEAEDEASDTDNPSLFDSYPVKMEEVEENEDVMVYAENVSFPQLFYQENNNEEYLFWFVDETLYFTKLITRGKGEIQRELIDSANSKIIVQNIPGQKIGCVINNDFMAIYFLDKNDSLSCIQSLNGGADWSVPLNW